MQAPESLGQYCFLNGDFAPGCPVVKTAEGDGGEDDEPLLQELGPEAVLRAGVREVDDDVA